MSWRTGRHYPIHVYEGDTPVATFFTAQDAERAVRAVNEQAAGTAELTVALFTSLRAMAAQPGAPFQASAFLDWAASTLGVPLPERPRVDKP